MQRIGGTQRAIFYRNGFGARSRARESRAGERTEALSAHRWNDLPEVSCCFDH